MKKFKIATTTLILCIFSLMYVSVPQTSAGIKSGENSESIQDALRQLRHEEWRVRDQALEVLKDRTEREDVQEALIGLLKRENDRREQWWRSRLYQEDIEPLQNEGYGEYYLNLLSTAIKIKDKAVLPALIPGSNSSIKVRQAIATFGAEAASPLAEALNKSVNKELWYGALKTVVLLLEQTELPQEELVQLKQAIMEKVESEESFVRKGAVKALAALGDPSVLPTLKRIKENDPYAITREQDGKETAKYPVREVAAEAIDKLTAE